MRGVLFNSQVQALVETYQARLTSGQRSLLETLLRAAQRASEESARAFFDTHLVRHLLTPSHLAGYFRPDDFEPLFKRPIGLSEGDAQTFLNGQRAKLAASVLPVLEHRELISALVKKLAERTGGDAGLVESLLTERGLLSLHGSPLVEVFAALAQRGLTTVPSPLRRAGDDAAAIARDGWLVAPVSGPYRFSVILDRAGARTWLRFAQWTKPVLEGAAEEAGKAIEGEAVDLAGGIAYHFTLEVSPPEAGVVEVLVQGASLSKGPLSRLALYPAKAWSDAEHAVTLVQKTIRLLEIVGIDERELRYLRANAASFDGIDLSTLHVGAEGEDVSDAADRFAQILRLTAYARLKQELAGGGDGLIAIFEANGTIDFALDEDKVAHQLDEKVYPLIARLTGQSRSGIAACVKDLFPPKPSFDNEKPLRRLWEHLQLVQRFGVPVTVIRDWTRNHIARGIVGEPLCNRPSRPRRRQRQHRSRGLALGGSADLRQASPAEA